MSRDGIRVVRAAFGVLVATMLVAGALAAQPAGRGEPKAPIPLHTFGSSGRNFADLRELRTTWYRVPAVWAEVVPAPGAFDFRALDRAVLPAAGRGFRVIIAIHSNASWATVCRTKHVFSAPRPGAVAAFRGFVQSVAERYDGDGMDDAPGLGRRVDYFQVENQWVAPQFFRDSTNCPGMSGGSAVADAQDLSEGEPGDPYRAAAEYVREYRAAYHGVRAANRRALVGPGNIPTQTADHAIFCEGGYGPRLVQNIVRVDGTVAETVYYTREEVCDPLGPNPRNIKTWVRYWNIVLESAMPRLVGKVDYLDLAQYGRYDDVQLRNEWAVRRLVVWGHDAGLPLVSWEMAGPDSRITLPGTDPHRDAALDLPKRIAVAFGGGTRAVTWFHNYFDPRACVCLRSTSLHGPGGELLPAYWNYRLVTGMLAGARESRLERVGGSDGMPAGYFVHFTWPSGKRVTVAWADEGMMANVPLRDSTATVVRANGRANPPSVERAAPNHVLRLMLTSVPIIVVD